MSISIRQVGPSIGAEVEGVDLRTPLDEDAARQVRQALLDYSVLVFRNQDLDEERFVNFSRTFGELEVHVLSQWLRDDYPEIYILSNIAPGGKDKPTGGDKVARFWHSDTSFKRIPATATILYALEVPSEGGNTEFADMYAAYEALSEREKQRLQDLRAVHDLEVSHNRVPQPPLTEQQKQEAPPVAHPVVRVHPETGRRALYMGWAHTSHIEDMDPSEGKALVDSLCEFATQRQFVYSHEWRVGDVVIWDNRCTMHRGTPYDDSERRMMWRTTIKGTDIPH